MAALDGVTSAIIGAAGAAGGGGFTIDRSLRFNDDDTAYLNRTPSGAGNQKTWTWSAWIKRSKIEAEANLFSVGASSTDGAFRFNSDDTLQVRDGAGGELTTSASYLDSSAWYHIVVALDTTQDTSSDRFKLYVNGAEPDLSAASYAAKDADGDFNAAVAHYIGRQVHNTSNLFDGYLAEIQFVDGTQLTASDFGAYDQNNVWQPKEYGGSYGTNGFYLKFDDNSSAAALGTDSSGNSNTWTVNNLDPFESIGLPPAYTADASTYTGTLSNIEFDDTNGITAAVNNIDFDLGASYTVGTITCKFLNGQGSASADYRLELHGNASYSDLLANSATVSAPSSGVVQTITHDFSSTSARYLRFAYRGGGRVGTMRFLSTTGATSSNAGCDSLIDTPTNYTAESGNNGGNYATLNTLDDRDSPTYTNGNLQVDGAGGSLHYVGRASIGVSSGKWYWEATINSSITSTYYPSPGISSMDESVPNQLGDGTSGHAYMADGQKYTNATLSSYGASFTQNDIIGFALDMDAGTLVAYKNGTSQGTMVTGLTGTWAPSWNQYQSTSLIYNFGQRPFDYTPPTDHVSLCSTNFADPTIADGSTAMNATTYTGNGSTQAVTGLNHSPDLAWIKHRTRSQSHVIYDIVRGAGTGKSLSSNSSGVEGGAGDGTVYGYLSAFGSDGFTVIDGSDAEDYVNKSGAPYIAWTWDGGSSTSSNSDGSITSSVRASQTNGFSVVGYTGTGVGATIGHGLNAAPEFIIVKNRETARPWSVFHQSITNMNSGYINLDANTAFTGSYTGVWNGTDPTSSVFSVGTDNESNNSGDDFIAYCWTPVSQYSSFGTYVGNGSNDGPFVFLDFRPRYILIKCSSDTGDWFIHDSARDPYNSVDDALRANLPNATSTTGDRMQFLSNGFKITKSNADMNGSGRTFIYAAFAEHPFKSARAR